MSEFVIDLSAAGEEARLREYLVDYIESLKLYYIDRPPDPFRRLALVVWFDKSPKATEQQLLALWTESGISEIRVLPPQPLYGKYGDSGPPFVHVHESTVEHFTSLLVSSQTAVARYFESRFEVLHYATKLLNREIIRAFKVITEPPRLLKGWYISADEFMRSPTPKIRNLLSGRENAKPEIGLVKVDESQERGLLHAEFSQQKWLPLSTGDFKRYPFYADLQNDRPGYFLFQGGSLYQLLKFEEKTAPEYADLVLETLSDDRYPEVYLRAVHPSEQAAA